MLINPTLLLAYLIVSTIGLIFVAAIWSRTGWLNILLKLGYSVAGVLGMVLTLKQAGLI